MKKKIIMSLIFVALCAGQSTHTMLGRLSRTIYAGQSTHTMFGRLSRTICAGQSTHTMFGRITTNFARKPLFPSRSFSSDEKTIMNKFFCERNLNNNSKLEELNPYKVLNILEDSSIEDIKKAYHQCALEFHPNSSDTKNKEDEAGAKKLFQIVQNSYEDLMKEAKAREIKKAKNENNSSTFCSKAWIREWLDRKYERKKEEKRIRKYVIDNYKYIIVEKYCKNRFFIGACYTLLKEIWFSRFRLNRLSNRDLKVLYDKIKKAQEKYDLK